MVIDGDDFYSELSTAEWHAMTVAEKSDRCIDWRSQRRVLETLVGGEAAIWHPYDWDTDDGSLAATTIIAAPKATGH